MLKQRIMTTGLLVPLVLLGVFMLPPVFFSLAIGVIAVLAAWEWANLAGWSAWPLRVLYAAFTAVVVVGAHLLQSNDFLLGIGLCWWVMAIILVIGYPGTKDLWRAIPVKLLIGWLILIPAWAGLNNIRMLNHGSYCILYFFSIVWISDIGAYFCGRIFGRHKLAPEISPGKTWEGAIGGIVMVTLFVLMVTFISGVSFFHALSSLIVSLIVTVFSMFGDLLESIFKRERDIKDSGNLLPGHGGVLDRIDSITAAAPIFAILAMLGMYTTGFL